MSHLSTHLPDVELVKSGNSQSGSLATLYNETWRSQDPYAVFTLLDVVRDRPEIRADVETADKVCALQWLVDGEVPLYLRTPFQCHKVVMRRAYLDLLAWIWSYFGRRWGERAGYKPDPKIGDASIFPPHNPFMGLNVVSLVQRQNIGVAITGTPGTGKSLFLLYVLALRLLARQTTVFHCRKGEFLIFDEAGVHKSKQMDSELFFLPEHTWFLVDSNQHVNSPPQAFFDACTSFSRKIILAASPREHRFTPWKSKELTMKTVWCDLFDFREILEIRSVQLTPMAELELQSFCNDYGPIARSAFELANDPDQHEANIRDNLSDVGQNELQGIISNLSAGFFDTKFSHNTIIARPMDDDRTKYSCNFASNKVAQIVIEHFEHVENIHALELYRLFLASPKARAAAGYLLKTIAFSELQRGGYWRLQPMKKLPIGADKTKQYWERHPGAPSFTLLTGHKGSSIKINKGFRTNYKRKDFAEVERIDYNPSDTLPETKPAMYVPRAPNNPAFDAWFYEPQLPEHHLVLIRAIAQMAPHEIKTGVLDWFESDEPLDLIVLSDDHGGHRIFTSVQDAGKIGSVYSMVYN